MGTVQTHKLTSQQDALLGDIAAAICARDLAAPAVMFLESMRPLNFVASQLMHGLGPMVSLFIEPKNWDMFAEALEHRETLGVLLDKIEAGGGADSSPS